MLIDITQEQFAQLSNLSTEPSAILIHRDENKVVLQGQYPNPPFEMPINDDNRAYLNSLSVPAVVKFSINDGVMSLVGPHTQGAKRGRPTKRAAKSGCFSSGSSALPIVR